MSQDVFNVKLLEFFTALMESRTLIQTGEKFGYSPAGSSRALSKLREAFGDPLFISSNKGLVPTSFAQSIYPQVVKTIDELRRLTEPGEFNPYRSYRTFHLASITYVTRKILGDIIPEFHRLAPWASIDVKPLPQRFEKELHRREIDIVFLAKEFVPPGMHFMPLFRITQSIICSKNHPLFEVCQREQRDPSPEEIRRYPLIHLRQSNPFFKARQNVSDMIKVFRDAEGVVYTDDTGLLLPMIADSDYLCLFPADEADRAMNHFPLEKLYVENRPEDAVIMGAAWIDATHKVPSLVWFRSLLKKWSQKNGNL